MKTLRSFPEGADPSKARIAPAGSVTIPASHTGHLSRFFSSSPQVFLLGKEEEEEGQTGMALDLPREWGSICDSRDRRRILREK